MKMTTNRALLQVSIFICVCLATSVLAETKDKLIAGGCATEYYLMKDLTEKYNPENLVTIDPRNTGNMKGLKMFLAGKTDFAFLSTHHKMLAKKMGIPDEQIQNIVSRQIAIEPILIVVNPETKVTNLSKEQLIAIFNGDVTNWKEVGGADQEIRAGVLNKDAKSGLYLAFKMMTVGMNNEFKGNNVNIPDPSISLNYVKNAPGAITFIGHSSYHHDPSLAAEISIDGIEPSDENFVNGKYPLVSKYFITYDQEKSEGIKPFLTFIDSSQGQDIINQKMIPVQGMVNVGQTRHGGHM